MIGDKDFSESMRQQMVERIKNDTGLMNLAARMGKTHLLE